MFKGIIVRLQKNVKTGVKCSIVVPDTRQNFSRN